MGAKLETKDVAVEYKADADRGIIEGHAAVFGNLDHDKDRILRGAFRKSIEEKFPANKIKVLWQHNEKEPIGVPTHLAEDSKGLEFRARISPTTRGKDAMILFKDEVVDRMSIGFLKEVWEYSQEQDVTARVLKELDLWELSPVTFPSNEHAAITAAKSRDFQVLSAPGWHDLKMVARESGEFNPSSFRTVELSAEALQEGGDDYLVRAVVGTPHGYKSERLHMLRFPKMAGWTPGRVELWLMENAETLSQSQFPETKASNVLPYRNLSLASRERQWDANAAESRIRSWAGAEEGPNRKYQQAFLWHDAENAGQFGAYKLPYADVLDGKLVAIPRAIFAAAGAMQGARGGVHMPSADREKVRSVIGRYYSKMASEWDDSSVVAPWKKSLDDESFLAKGLQEALRIFSKGGE